jgi:hypothetical protein
MKSDDPRLPEVPRIAMRRQSLMPSAPTSMSFARPGVAMARGPP